MDNSAKRTGHHLKQIRALAGLSQYSVSLGTGIDRSRLSSIENGYVSARTDEIEQIERLDRVLSVGHREANDLCNDMTSNVMGDAIDRQRCWSKRGGR